MRIGATIDARTPFRGILDIARHPFDQIRGRLAASRVRNVIAQEFNRGGGFTPTGFQAWPPTKTFGTRPATTPPLGGAGSSLLAAWRGGPGGSLSITGKRVTLAVSLPYAAAQREGARIRITPRMRAFVRGMFGVNLRPEKSEIVIPARPHANAAAPEFVAAARSVLLEAITAEAA